jgi:hypothetical protein
MALKLVCGTVALAVSHQYGHSFDGTARPFRFILWPVKGKRVVGRVLGGGDRAIAATVYGTVLAMAALAAGAVEHLDPGRLIAVVASTSVVIWIAHVYAHTLGESIERGRRLDWPEFNTVAGREVPILAATAGPISVLLLGAFGVIGEKPDIWLAFGVGFVALAVQGARYARVEELGRGGTAAVIALNLALGGLVVLLKVLISH